MTEPKARVRTLATVGAVLLALVVAQPASAQTPPGTEGQFSYRPTESARGDSIFFDAKCLWGGSGQGVQLDVNVVEFTDDPTGTRFGTTVDVAADGTASGTLTVPKDAHAGKYTVGALCRLEDQAFFSTQPGPFTVTGPSPARSTPTTTTATANSSDSTKPNELPRTGGNGVGMPAAVAALLIVAGASIGRRSQRLRSEKPR